MGKGPRKNATHASREQTSSWEQHFFDNKLQGAVRGMSVNEVSTV